MIMKSLFLLLHKTHNGALTWQYFFLLLFRLFFRLWLIFFVVSHFFYIIKLKQSFFFLFIFISLNCELINEFLIVNLAFQNKNGLFINVVLIDSFELQTIFLQILSKTILQFLNFCFQKIKNFVFIDLIVFLSIQSLFQICKFTYFDMLKVVRNGFLTDIALQQSVYNQKIWIVFIEGGQRRLQDLIIVKECSRGQNGEFEESFSV